MTYKIDNETGYLLQETSPSTPKLRAGSKHQARRLVRFINRTEIEVERFEKNIYATDLNENHRRKVKTNVMGISYHQSVVLKK